MVALTISSMDFSPARTAAVVLCMVDKKRTALVTVGDIFCFIWSSGGRTRLFCI